jgi:PAS domain S-box-containing protein
MESEKYRTLTENAPEVIARFDLNTQFIYVSPSVQKAMGLTPESMLGKTIEQIDLLKPVSNRLIEALTRAFKDRKLQAGEFSLQTAGGLKVFKFTFAPEIVNDQATSAVSVFTDITELEENHAKHTP